LATIGALSAEFGCNHTAGVCDCNIGPSGYDAPPLVLRPVPNGAPLTAQDAGQGESIQAVKSSPQ